jgi:hypothetical protein
MSWTRAGLPGSVAVAKRHEFFFAIIGDFHYILMLQTMT